MALKINALANANDFTDNIGENFMIVPLLIQRYRCVIHNTWCFPTVQCATTRMRFQANGAGRLHDRWVKIQQVMRLGNDINLSGMLVREFLKYSILILFMGISISPLYTFTIETQDGPTTNVAYGNVEILFG